MHDDKQSGLCVILGKDTQRKGKTSMNKQKNTILFSLLGNLFVFGLVIYLYMQEGRMTPVYMGLLVINAVIFLINLAGFFAGRK